MRNVPQNGFTLVELLLALTIFAIIGVGIHQTLRSGVDAQRHGEESVQIVQIARQVLSRITGDLRATYTSQGVYGGAMIGEDDIGVDVDLDRLSFTTANHTPKPYAVGEYALATIEHFIDDDDATENVGLQRHVLPVAEATVEEELEVENYASEVKSLNFRYYNGLDWTDSWDSTADGVLPLAVEVTIGLSLENEGESRASTDAAAAVLRRFSTTVRLQLASRTAATEMIE